MDHPADVCSCCARPWRLLDSLIPEYARGLHRGLRDVDSVCRECIPHQGWDFRAVADHRALWPVLLDAVETAHGDEVERLQTAIRVAEAATAAARRELAERPVQEVEKYLDQDVLEAAKNEAERAFRSRERAWGALCEVRLQHREMDAGRCRCGARWQDCPTAQVVRNFPQLERWEREQARRLVERLPHGLPPSHPAVLDPNVASRLAARQDPYEDGDPYEDEFLQSEAAQPPGGVADVG